MADTTNNNQIIDADSLELAQLCVQICDDTKAKDILLFDVREKTIVADYYIVCSGTSMPHIRAIAEHIRKAMAEKGLQPRGMDGQPESRWMDRDYGLILVHILEPEMRNFYALEELWDEARIIERK
jgi:ribosome-associated protein